MTRALEEEFDGMGVVMVVFMGCQEMDRENYAKTEGLKKMCSQDGMKGP